MDLNTKMLALNLQIDRGRSVARSALPSSCFGRIRRSSWRALLALLAMLMPFAAPCMAQSPSLTPETRMDLESQPGVVLIVASFKADLGPFSCEPAALGTGFLYRPDGYLITNGHVVQMGYEKDQKATNARTTYAIQCLLDDARQAVSKKLGRQLSEDDDTSLQAALAKLVESGEMHITGVSLTVYLDNEAKYTGEVKAYSDPIDEGGKDVAIVKIDGSNLPTVPLGNSDEVNVGDPITVIGYPGAATNATLSGLFSQHSIFVPTVTDGRISAVKTDFRGTRVLQSEATINHGNSGGPAFDSHGHAIGIATYSLDKAEGSVSGLNFFVPINTALEFVRQAGADPQRGAFDQLWHDAVEAYAGQHWSKAHELMGNVLEMMPNQPDAVRLQLQAGQNIPRNPIAYWIDRLGAPMFFGIAGGVVLLVILIMVLAFRPSKKAAPPAALPPVAAPPSPLAAAMPQSTVAELSPVSRPQQALPPNQIYGTLYIANGPLAGNRFSIPKSGLVIGRDPSQCAVVLPGDAVSKEHAWVVPVDDGVAVIDRNSANGTYVNSVDSPRINKFVLKNGDRIFVGRKNPTEITFFASH
jgi:serine protease Do